MSLTQPARPLSQDTEVQRSCDPGERAAPVSVAVPTAGVLSWQWPGYELQPLRAAVVPSLCLHIWLGGFAI